MPSARLQVLDRRELPAVQHRHELDAGIDRAMLQPALAVRLGEHHRAGAAIAFRAAFLRAHAPLVPAEIFEHRQRRRHAVERALLVAQQEADLARHQLPR